MYTIYLLYAPLTLLLIGILNTLWEALSSPLLRVPGPFLARFTSFWYLRSSWLGSTERDQIALHRKYAGPGQFYAPIVRLAPNMYSIAMPDKSVYGVQSRMPKSKWYDAWKHPAQKQWTLFPLRDIKMHAEARRKFQSLYTLSSLVAYEKYIDDCVKIFLTRMKEAANRGQTINLGYWLQCYAFDVIGAITYGKRLGFLDSGEDIGGLIAGVDKTLKYSMLVGIYPWVHPYLYGLMQKFQGSAAASRNMVMQFAVKSLDDRVDQRARKVEKEHIDLPNTDDGPRDFIDKMLDLQSDEARHITRFDIVTMSLANMFAGSDTTGVSLSSLFYHLIKTPRVLKELRIEIQKHREQGQFEGNVASFKVSQGMEYLQACIKEALRLHSAVGLPLWRECPPEGVTINGNFFPAGTDIGLNAWVAHYNADIWGEDVEEFRPERWLEAQKEGGQRIKHMEANFVPFGLGSRTCIGKHISLMEMSKLVPTMIEKFDFELEIPGGSWKSKNYWFTKPQNFMLRVKEM